MTTVEIAVAGEGWDGIAGLEALAERAIAAAERAMGKEGAEAREVSILFADDAGVRALNARYREKDRPTNVLSFPAARPGPLLGDIALAFETCRREAESAGIALAHHVAHLVVHGYLHLLGHDHEDEAEAERMEGIERAALALIGIGDPYAAPASPNDGKGREVPESDG